MKFKIDYGLFGLGANPLYSDLFRKLEIVESGPYDKLIELDGGDSAYRTYIEYYPFEPVEHDEFIRLADMVASNDRNSSKLGIDILYGASRPVELMKECLDKMMAKFIEWPHSYDLDESELLRHKLLFIIRRLAL